MAAVTYPTFLPISREQFGIACPKCHKTHSSRVHNTRKRPHAIRRVRKCQSCGFRFRTMERLE